ncbi:hypothetical protein [Sphingorhabdus sp. M41]|uniref:hypothetical protein n=1 Tax=Sphingorhabdus sp. M41 TaxID=1806885 RepID=UPI00078E8594|nr:hypothetical protein [Sphingorhabdus sp. M41]AMO72856.1 hypothetical protein AZE99_14245 [Sphingorhabdus sp. M41]
MIESGSHTPGIDPAWFELRAGTAMRWEQPDKALEGLIGDYFIFDSEGPESIGASEWMLPNWPTIRLVLAENPMTIEAPDWRWSPLPEAGFYGPTSRIMKHISDGGVTVGVSMTPAGVARLFDIDLSLYRDRMVRLQSLLPVGCEALVAELRASDRGPAVKSILDRFFLAQMKLPHPAEAQIIALNRLLLDENFQNVRELSRALELPIHSLARLACKRFGYPPKILLTRTRFLRSLIALKQAGTARGYSVIDEAYTDASHFLRDSERFLGMTTRRFLKLDTPFLDAILRARQLILGTATPTLGPAIYREQVPED